jgi:predicted RNase H-like HicB family nuclease
MKDRIKKMEADIILNIQLSFELVKKEKWYVASCPALDVFSQGETEIQAEKNLRETLCLFLTSCIERGTLDTVLKECGFKSVSDYRPETMRFL